MADSVISNTLLFNGSIHKQIELMSYGDSITEIGAPYLDDNILNVNFVGAYKNVNLHGGISSQFVSDMAGRIADDITQFNSSDSITKVFIIHAGTNDVSAGIAWATSQSHWETILDTIIAYNPKINIYVDLIIPQYSHGDVVPYNTALQSFLEANYPSVNIIDMYSRWIANPSWADDTNGYMSPADGLHPNLAGYNVKQTQEYICMLNTNAQYCNGN